MIAVVLLAAAPLYVEAGGRLEGAVGVAAVRPGAPSEPVTAWTLTPTAALQRRHARGRSELRYVPRLFLRQPNLLGLNRPLLLQALSLSHREVLSARTVFALRVTGTLGELDYTSVASALPTQTTGAPTSVLSVGTAVGEASVSHRLGPLSALDVTTFGDHLATYGEGPRLDASQVGVRVLPSRRVSRRTQLRLPLQLSWIHAYALPASALVTARVGAAHAVDVHTEGEAEFGFAAAQPLSGGALSWYPELRLALHRRSSLGRGMPLTFGGMALVNTRVDRLRGTLLPIGGVEFDATLGMGRWTSRASVGAFTSVSRRPILAGQPESVLTGGLLVRRPLPPSLAFEVGLRGYVRAPHLAERGPLTETTVLAFSALAWGSSTDPHFGGP